MSERHWRFVVISSVMSLNCNSDDYLILTTIEDMPPTTGAADEGPEPTPTTSGEPPPCAGYDDVCIYSSPNVTKQKYRCGGFVRANLSAYVGFTIDDTVEFGSLLSFSKGTDDVIACCDDDYEDGCDETEGDPLPSPQAVLCAQDCAQQACLEIAQKALYYSYDFKNYPGLYNEAKALVTYINDHSNDCRDAILNNNLCIETGSSLCNEGPLIRVGIYEVPNNGSDWPGFTDIKRVRLPLDDDGHESRNEGQHWLAA